MNGEFVLLVQSPSLPCLYFNLATGKLALGRSSACDYVVHDATVSRRHAEIAVDGELVIVSDLDSLNGTYINEKRIRTGVVQQGQRLRFGAVTFLLAYHNGSDEESESDLETDKCGEKGHPSAPQMASLLLSPAQRRVLEFLLDGLAEKRIAVEIGISPHTVHNHVMAVYQFLGVHSRSELLARLLHRNDDLG